MDCTADWLEGILQRKAHEESPLKVLFYEKTSGVMTKGENYMSKIERIKAEVLLNSGKVKKLSLIVKNEHDTETMKKLSAQIGVFLREITMYRDILPKMKDLLDEVGDTEETLWPTCYDVRLYDRLIFEDLGTLGYKMPDRKSQMGLNSGLFVLRRLAKFHALSKILLDRGEIPLDIFRKHIWANLVEESSSNINNNFVRLAKAMDKWGDDWKDAMERVKKAAPNMGQRVFEALGSDPNEFNVLCHGDCWSNNMMIRGEDPEHITSVKFIDLQLCYVITPAKDIPYFLNTSVKQEVVEEHFDLFIDTYCDTLKSYLLKFGFEGTIPDADSMKAAINKRKVIEVGEALCFLPIMLGDQQKAPDLEEVMKSELEAAEKGEKSPDLWDIYQNMDPKSEKLVKAKILEGIKLGIL